MAVKLSEKTVMRVHEMMGQLRGKTLEEVVEWAVLRVYNRQRAVRRHALSLKDIELEISPLEERDTPRGRDDE